MMHKLMLSMVLALGCSAAAATPTCADPCVPQRLRHAPTTPPASGAALQQQAVEKLRQRFNQADLDANGALTVDEARKAGLGWVVNHFADIDTAHSGKVTFDDVRSYMGKRRKQVLGPAAPQ